MSQAPQIEKGKTYRINPRYNWHKIVTIRVQSIMHRWTDDDGNELVCVWAYRVRPSNLSVSFGNGRGYVARVSQFERVTDETSEDGNRAYAGCRYSTKDTLPE